MIGAQRHAFGILRGRKGLLNVLRHVDHDRSGLAVRRDVERLGDGLGNLIRALHEEAVLGDRTADAVHVGLLEGVGADLAHGDLARHANERDAVHVGGGESRNGVGSAGAGGDDADAGLAGGARIAVGRMDAPLLVPTENELERRVRQAVEYVQNRTTGITENNFRASLGNGIHKRLGAANWCVQSFHAAYYTIKAERWEARTRRQCRSRGDLRVPNMHNVLIVRLCSHKIRPCNQRIQICIFQNRVA